MSNYNLKVKKRSEEQLGKNKSRQLRSSGLLPGNLLTKGKAISLTFEKSQLDLLLRSGLRSSSIINIEWEEANKKNQAIVKELQRNPINNNPIHVDFYELEEKKPLLVKIALEPTGIAKGVKLGGALEQFIHALKVKTTPKHLQEIVQMDISHLDIGEALYFKDLNLPSEWKVILEGNPIILKIAKARVSTKQEGDNAENSEEENTEAGKTT